MDFHEMLPTLTIIALLLLCQGICILAVEDSKNSSTTPMIETLFDIDNTQGSVEHANNSPRRTRQFGYRKFASGFGGFSNYNGFSGYDGYGGYGGGYSPYVGDYGGSIQHSVTRTSVVNRYGVFSGIFKGGYGGVYGGRYNGGYDVKYGGSGGYGSGYGLYAFKGYSTG